MIEKMREDEIREESRSHDCPIGGISLHVLTKEEADLEDKKGEGIMTEKEQVITEKDIAIRGIEAYLTWTPRNRRKGIYHG